MGKVLILISQTHSFAMFSRSYWIFAEQGGVLNVLPEICTWVRKGEPIAYLHSLFGGILQTYVAPEDGIVIGKSVDPVCERYFAEDRSCSFMA